MIRFTSRSVVEGSTTNVRSLPRPKPKPCPKAVPRRDTSKEYWADPRKDCSCVPLSGAILPT
eukprot:scaffold447_cov307-Pinguiococcus_pyrenoidosus.AAC.32